MKEYQHLLLLFYYYTQDNLLKSFNPQPLSSSHLPIFSSSHINLCFDSILAIYIYPNIQISIVCEFPLLGFSPRYLITIHSEAEANTFSYLISLLLSSRLSRWIIWRPLTPDWPATIHPLDRLYPDNPPPPLVYPLGTVALVCREFLFIFGYNKILIETSIGPLESSLFQGCNIRDTFYL